MWATIPHFYRGGTPYENYVFADLLAQRYFAMYKADPAGFAKRYVAMQRNGYDDTPPNLLRKFMGIDLKDPKVYDAVFAQQAKYLADLEALYKKVPVK
jgi:oligoendopeptidase F